MITRRDAARSAALTAFSYSRILGANASLSRRHLNSCSSRRLSTATFSTVALEVGEADVVWCVLAAVSARDGIPVRRRCPPVPATFRLEMLAALRAPALFHRARE